MTPRQFQDFVADIRELSGKQRRARLEDFVWSLLNCREFSVNR